MNKKYRVFQEIGKIMVNFGNLTFASLILGSIIKGDYDRLSIILVGGCFVAIFVTGGIILLTAEEEK